MVSYDFEYELGEYVEIKDWVDGYKKTKQVARVHAIHKELCGNTSYTLKGYFSDRGGWRGDYCAEELCKHEEQPASEK